MISSQQFERDISKSLQENMTSLGFQGSGLSYILDTDFFLLSFSIRPNPDGDKCCAEFTIKLKKLKSYVDGAGVVFPKPYPEREFTKRLVLKGEAGEWVEYSENQAENIKIANDIFEAFTKQAMPIVALFKRNPI